MYMIKHSTNFKNLIRRSFAAVTAMLLGMSSTIALANTSYGLANDWQMGTQSPATDLMFNMIKFHNLLLWVTGLVVLFVGVLLLIVIFKYNAKKNPVPATFTHNTFIEVAWTVIPIIILIVIAVPSFSLLYQQRVIPEADYTIKVTGNQWYWTYEYPDNGNIEFNSIMIPEDEITGDQIRLLSVDNEMVVPVNKTIRLIVTASDVLHAWTIPSFGVKIDTIPGRLNEAWFKANREGIYYGQCSELCGRGHAYMPIAVRVVSEAEFAEWVEEAKIKFAAVPTNKQFEVASTNAAE